MTAFLQWLWHVLYFSAPALGLASVLLLFLRLKGADAARREPKRVWWTLFLSGFATSCLGTAWTGLDGAMVTYGGLVLVTGVVSAWFARA